MPKVVYNIFLILLGVLVLCPKDLYSQAVGPDATSPTQFRDFHLKKKIVLGICFNTLTGDDDITFSVKNTGTDTISTLRFFWDSDGVTNGPLDYPGILLPGQVSSMTIGSFNFPTPGNYSFKIWGDLGVGYASQNTADDTMTIAVNVFPNQAFTPVSDLKKCLNDSAELVAPVGFSSYNWGVGTTQRIKVKSTGGYIVKLTDSNGCVSRDTVQVENFISPSKILDADTSLCGGTPLKVNAPLGFKSYVWNSGVSNSRSIDVTTSGLYHISVKDTNNCTYSDEIQVTFKDVPAVRLKDKVAICKGDKHTLVAGTAPGQTYTWSKSGAVDSALVVNSPGIYKVTVTNSVGCSSVDSTELVVNNLPTPALPQDTVLCNGETQTLSLGQSYQGIKWSTGKTTTTIDVSQAGVYTVTVTDGNNCKGETQIKLVEKTVNVSLGADYELCKGDVYLLQPNGSYDSYLWGDGSTQNSKSISTGGTYKLKVTKYGFCSANDSVKVKELPIPVASFNVNAGNGKQVQFNNTSNVTSSSYWTFGDGVSSTSENPTHNYAQVGSYTVTLKVENKCSAHTVKKKVHIVVSAMNEIKFISDMSVYPNPAKDILELKVRTQNVDKLSVNLFNAVGQLMKSWNTGLQATEHTQKLDVSGMASGVYLLSVSSGGAHQIKKIVIE